MDLNSCSSRHEAQKRHDQSVTARDQNIHACGTHGGSRSLLICKFLDLNFPSEEERRGGRMSLAVNSNVYASHRCWWRGKGATADLGGRILPGCMLEIIWTRWGRVVDEVIANKFSLTSEPSETKRHLLFAALTKQAQQLRVPKDDQHLSRHSIGTRLIPNTSSRCTKGCCRPDFPGVKTLTTDRSVAKPMEMLYFSLQNLLPTYTC